ncbi:hypothetical protein [uncultured Ilyobacter sp.]|uniref:hypothetical protein n=1 Tax=uncultured Ilyobacter sp. TaxID=544433 RepID=UPI002AA90A3D|nr:hypothetical protein [uncultured Ilyobacter sp.]
MVINEGGLGEVYRLIKENPRYQIALKTNLESINYDLISFVNDRLGHDVSYAIDPTKTVIDLGFLPRN